MMRFLALLGFILLFGLQVTGQSRTGNKNTAAKPDTATGRSNPASAGEVQSLTDEKDEIPAPPSSNGSSVLFAVKNADYESPRFALITRQSSADKTSPYLSMQAQMAGITPDQLEATARKEIKPVKPSVAVIDVKSFATKNKNTPQPALPKELLASIKVKDSLRAIETAKQAMELGNTDAEASGRKTIALNSVAAAKADPQDKPAVQLPSSPVVKNASAQLPVTGSNKQAGNSGAENKAGSNTVASTITEADKKTDPEKYVFDKTVFNEMDSKKYPIIIEIPKDSNSANTTGGGDFPKPYTTKRKRVRLFLSADENVELPVEQIVIVRYPRLSIQIKLADQNIHNIRDVKLMMTLTNNTTKTQTFLFDRPVKTGFSMWGGACKIVGSGRNSVLKYEGKPEYEAREFARKDFDHYAFKIKASEWFIKKILVSDIVVTDERVCPGGNLPPDTYTLQLVFQGNYSNVVSFTVY
jgi:hypothetical protein